MTLLYTFCSKDQMAIWHHYSFSFKQKEQWLANCSDMQLTFLLTLNFQVHHFIKDEIPQRPTDLLDFVSQALRHIKMDVKSEIKKGNFATLTLKQLLSITLHYCLYANTSTNIWNKHFHSQTDSNHYCNNMTHATKRWDFPIFKHPSFMEYYLNSVTVGYWELAYIRNHI